MDDDDTLKRMWGLVALVLAAVLLLTWLLESGHHENHVRWACFKDDKIVSFSDKEPVPLDNGSIVVYDDDTIVAIKSDGCVVK